MAHIQHVVRTRPEIAFAVRRLPLLDQLELTVELLNEVNGPEAELPSNVIPFRPRRTR